MTTPSDHDNDTDHMFRFGDKPHEVLHPDTVEAMLRGLRATNPALFGRLLAESFGIERRRRT